MRRYKTILVGTDFSELSDVAVAAAARWAELAGAERIHLVHALRPWAWPAPLGLNGEAAGVWPRIVELANEDLLHVDVPAKSAKVTRRVVTGPPARELVIAAREIEADLIVVATHALGPLKRAVLGSVASALVRSASCPVLVVGQDRPAVAPKKVVAAIDLSPVSSEVLLRAAEVTPVDDGSLLVLSAYDMERALRIDEKRWGVVSHPFSTLGRRYRSAIVDLVNDTLGKREGVKIEVATSDPPSKLILETLQAEKADLVVLGTSGHSAWERMWLGSTATRVISQAPCPVLVIPAGAKP